MPPRDAWATVTAGLRERLERTTRLAEGRERLERLEREGLGIAPTPKEEVWRDGKVRLYRYAPRVESPHQVPVLVVFAIFNRFYVIDLQEDRSLVRRLLDLGLDVYALDWGYPDRSDRFTTLDDYVSAYIDDAVEEIRARHGIAATNLLGICQGGTMSLCYAALHPEKVRNLVAMITPVDFHAGGSLIQQWLAPMDARATVDALGLVPGELVTLGFMIRSPFARGLQKYVDMVDVLDDDEKLASFARMEQWVYDTPDVPGEAYRQWIEDFYQGNKLIRGEVELGGRRVDLRAVTMPVLNLYAEADDICLPAMTLPLSSLVGTSDYTARSFPVGHIGMYVSGKVQHTLPPALAEWLRARCS
jgi:polyhydroxyalkanoate synthase